MHMHRGFFDQPAYRVCAEHGSGASTLEWVIFALTVAILLGVLVLLLDRFARRPKRDRTGTAFTTDVSNEPLAILRHRYSSGEISREEYLQMSEDLGAPASVSNAPTANDERRGSSRQSRPRNRRTKQEPDSPS